MDFEDVIGLLTRELGAVPIPLEVVRVELWAPRVTPRDSEVLRELFARYPGEHPVEVVVHNGLGGKTLLAPEVRVGLEIREAITGHFGEWAVL